MEQQWQQQILSFDDRRDLIMTDQSSDTLSFCTEQLIEIGQDAIVQRGVFNLALSGGSTPKTIFQTLASNSYRERLDWSRVKLFWSDERSVAPSDSESNYHMAMEAGFHSLPIPKENIFRMPADSKDMEKAAAEYEKTLIDQVPNASLDMVMLGMGEDGHTASLFPKTQALHAENQLVVANFVPQKNTWRMSFTFACINNAKTIIIYVFGKNKAEMIERVLNSAYDPDNLPIQRIGTRARKALWMVDQASASKLKL